MSDVEMTTVTCKPCIHCGVANRVEVRKTGYDQWKQGAFIQVALPELTPDQREMLISGTCPPCFEELFGDDD